LKKIRDKVAGEIGLDSSIIAPRNALEAVAIDPNSPALMKWQRQLLDLPLLKHTDHAPRPR